MGGTLHLRLRRPEGQDHGGVRLGAEHQMGVHPRRGGVHPELVPGQHGVQPLHQHRVDGVVLQQHRRQAQGEGVPGRKALQRGAGVQDAPVQLLCVRHKGAACRRQHHTGGAALEQRQIQLFFQTADLVAECGLGAVQLLCGGGKVQYALHGQKTQQLMVVHGWGFSFL